jgi:hypothetical protein
MAYDVERPNTNGLWTENVSLADAVNAAGRRHLMAATPVRIRNRDTGKVVTYNRKIKAGQTREQAKAQIDAYARKISRALTGQAARVSGPAGRATGYAKAGRQA